MDIRSMEFAHDLKTPIQLICACVQMLEMETDASPRAKKYLQMLNQSADQLWRMAARALETEAEMDASCDLAWIVRSLSGQFALLCAEKKVSFAADANIDSLRMRGDRVMIERILQNLLANALRYTPKGGRIELSLHARNDFAEIAVSDTGCGVGEEMRERIFEIGVSDGSTGLGLPAARAMAEAMGGAIRLECPQSGGSRFLFRLPLAGA